LTVTVEVARDNQKTLKAETYSGLRDAVAANNHLGAGQRIILLMMLLMMTFSHSAFLSSLLLKLASTNLKDRAS
jgi:hypothetical protein